jgi:anti-anti-sigma factor
MEGPNFDVGEERDGSRLVLAPRGEVDLATVDGLENAIARAAGSEIADVWVDLSDVDFIDSTGLTALLAGHRALTGDGVRRFTIICPEGPVRRALEISGLDGVLRVCHDRASAD